MKIVGLRLQGSQAFQSLSSLRRTTVTTSHARHSRNITFPVLVSLGQPKGDVLARPNRLRPFSQGPTWQAERSGTPSDGDSSPQTIRKRKKPRAAPGTTSLRSVAVEAERSRDGLRSPQASWSQVPLQAKRARAYCVAERFDSEVVVKILLERKGYRIDPYGTALYPQVVHAEVMRSTATSRREKQDDTTSADECGDVFIFPSGTVVVWSVPEAVVSDLVNNILVPAAENPHLDQSETEDLQYIEDSSRESSCIKGDTIILGTKTQDRGLVEDRTAELQIGRDSATSDPANLPYQRSNADNMLTKIAFSSGLARSTKLAVLESLLNNYFESTRSIPTLLSRGSRLPFTRSFILRKTGQLLSVRAQLNLYSELTDSLPDLFWECRHELGLEGYYDQVGRALDVGIRIKTLNERMDYAQEIASILRERLSEKHGLVLEWMIITLITIEVAFEILRLYKEGTEGVKRGVPSSTSTGT
ncbi:MAG: hypothetical protein M1816_005538 [Peltula sp. TS41687]|nr:MAG: hypothetical protein M1816_005538 [Peltula sp. TS41687]